MKKIILFLFISASVTAQMKITEATPSENVGQYRAVGNKFAEITKRGDRYFFTYLDIQRDDYKSFPFAESDFENLYILFSNFQEGKEMRAQLDHGDVLVFTYRKTFGKKFIDVVHIDDVGIDRNMKEIPLSQVDKLFGKTKNNVTKN